ncbi:MAG: hypothetical protein AAGJ87_16550, partial [Pseudomonadota bacterium]
LIVGLARGAALERDVLDGARWAFRTFRDADAAPRLLARSAISIADYYSGAFTYPRAQGAKFFGVETKDAWLSAWREALAGDRDALRARVRDHLTGTDDVPFTLGWTLARTRDHKAIARAYGVDRLVYYEGGSHDRLDPDLSRVPGAAAFYKDWRASDEAGETRRIIDTALIEETPGIMLADFTHIGPNRPGSNEEPWEERDWATVTPQAEAIYERLSK